MIKFRATIKNGELDFGSEFNLARWQEFLRDNAGKKVSIDIPKPIRSLSQNALYWVYLAKIEHETGNTAEDMHEFCKEKFLPKKLITIKGKVQAHEVIKDGTTTGLNKADFGEYMRKIEVMTGILVPSKEEAEEMGYILNK